MGFIRVKISVAEIWLQEVRFCTYALLLCVFVIVFAFALPCDFPLLASALRFQMFHWKIPDLAFDYQTNDLLNRPSLAAANLRYPKAISLFVCINRLWHRSDLFDGKLMDSKNSKSTRDVWLVNTHFKPGGRVMLWKHNRILHTMSCINNKKVEIIKLPDLSCISVLPPLCGIFVLAPCPSYISENRKVPGPRMAVQAGHPRLQSIPWHGRRRARGNLMLATQALWSCGSGRALVSEAERFIPPALVVHVWVNTPE